MKIKKLVAVFAAVAMAVSMMTISASASNFANVTYGDDDPTMGSIISKSADSFTVAPTGDGLQFKAKLQATDLLADPSQVGDITKITATITYDSANKVPHAYLGGGLWTNGGAQSDWSLKQCNVDEEDNMSYSGPISTDIEVKFLLPKQHLTAEACSMVFIDWSANSQDNGSLSTDGMTLTVSNLKFLDKDGNEIAQAEFSGTAGTTAPNTGNSIAIVVAAMAVAGTAAVAVKKRK